MPLSLTYMNEGLEIMRALVASSPQNAPQRHILGEMYSARASNFLKLHKPEPALKDLKNACAIHESFREADRSDDGASINAAACIKQMGIAAALSGDSKLAAKYFRQALVVVEPVLAAARHLHSMRFTPRPTLIPGWGTSSLMKPALPDRASHTEEPPGPTLDHCISRVLRIGIASSIRTTVPRMDSTPATRQTSRRICSSAMSNFPDQDSRKLASLHSKRTISLTKSRYIVLPWPVPRQNSKRHRFHDLVCLYSMLSG